MAHLWRGIIREYADLLPAHLSTHVVSIADALQLS
ncbi:threonine synthase [Sanguibacter antarcticus]|uniref:Threonine synthase n=1 Tax=Sanguibacter antarcticus TaxID=372484 RepID=A0A2A9E0Y5_9MICO|nr:threonine synthase [Sanguibacter antarcticus]